MNRPINAEYLFRSTDPSQNRDRYYRITASLDLFGVPVIVKEWGRAGRRPAGISQESFGSGHDARHALARAIRRRRRRGYRHMA
jgi:predicted DNA-binding WGR domain protein